MREVRRSRCKPIDRSLKLLPEEVNFRATARSFHSILLGAGSHESRQIDSKA